MIKCIIYNKACTKRDKTQMSTTCKVYCLDSEEEGNGWVHTYKNIKKRVFVFKNVNAEDTLVLYVEETNVGGQTDSCFECFSTNESNMEIIAVAYKRKPLIIEWETWEEECRSEDMDIDSDSRLNICECDTIEGICYTLPQLDSLLNMHRGYEDGILKNILGEKIFDPIYRVWKCYTIKLITYSTRLSTKVCQWQQEIEHEQHRIIHYELQSILPRLPEIQQIIAMFLNTVRKDAKNTFEKHSTAQRYVAQLNASIASIDANPFPKRNQSRCYQAWGRDFLGEFS